MKGEKREKGEKPSLSEHSPGALDRGNCAFT